MKKGSLNQKDLSKKARRKLRGNQGPQGERGLQGERGPEGPSTGAAGGDLTGNYPDPTIAAGSVDPANWGTIPQVRAKLGATPPIPNNTLTNVPWAAEDFDTADMHDNTTNNSRLTAPIAGVYLVTANLDWSDSGVAGVREIVFSLNSAGAPYVHRDHVADAGTGYDTMQSTSTTLKLAAGDFIIVNAFQNSGGTLNVGSNSNSFTMSWIGPG